MSTGNPRRIFRPQAVAWGGGGAQLPRRSSASSVGRGVFGPMAPGGVAYNPLVNASDVEVELGERGDARSGAASGGAAAGASSRVVVPEALEREAPSRGAQRSRRLLRMFNVSDPSVL